MSDAAGLEARSDADLDNPRCPAPSDRHPRYAAGEKLGAEITSLCGHLYAKTYRLLCLIREFDEQGYWQLPGLCSCAHWLNWQCGIGMNAAREKVRVARALADLPKVSAAFEQGELSYSKVRAMTRVADVDNEDYLLMIARHGTAWHMEKLVAKYAQAKRLQDAENARAQYEAREVTFYMDETGSLVLKARLPAETGELVMKALEKAMDRQFREACDESGISAASAATDGEAPDYGEVPDISAETSDQATYPQRRADALAEIAESYLANGHAESSTADRYQVVLHVSAETLASESTPKALPHAHRGPAVSHLEDGHHVSAETSRRLACDGSLLRLVEDEEGEPLSIGRRSRAIPPAIRRALRIRDKGCRFPGCTRTAYLDGHHITHWADGGETSLDNLIQLCRHHHRLVHEGGFSCERTAAGEVTFKDGRQECLPSYCRLSPEEERREFDAWLERELRELGITPQTCVTRWQGEEMDWDLAVGHLFVEWGPRTFTSSGPEKRSTQVTSVQAPQAA